MSRKSKATPSSLPVRPSGKGAATVALSKDTSPEPSKPALDPSYGERLAHNHPDAQYWLPFDNTVNYRSSFSQPPLKVERFLYTVYKVTSAVKSKFPKPFVVSKTNSRPDLSFYLRLKPPPEVMQVLKVYTKGACIALNASFGIPQVDTPTLTPPYHPKDPLDDSDNTLPTFTKGKGKAASSARKHARSPSDEESEPKKHQSRRKAKPSDSDADYVVNDDDKDHDELANDAEESAEPEQAPEGPEARKDEEEEGKDEEDEEEEEEEVIKAPPKKAAKGVAGGKAKVVPATALAAPISPPFAGPPSDPKKVKAMPVEQIGHDLVIEASKLPFLNKGPPTCTNCIPRSHDCKPCITSCTNHCQRCNNGHMVCSRGRTAPELLTSFERLRPILTVSPSALNTALISLVAARRELDLQWIQLTRMSAQYDQQLQELVDIILQQNDAFNAEYVRLFYEDSSDREVLQGLLERALRHTSPEERHRDRDIDALPNFGAVKPILQQTPGLVPVAPSHPLVVPLTQEAALQVFAKPLAAVPSSNSSLVAGPSTAPLFPSPGHTLIGLAVPPSTSAEMEGVENAGS
ncbi:hypothetical protein DFH08DRAFT_825004 [Mycena albidolilacea]|uniref:Uncharacterized protein n=1 Tax=Mycena albidolilacea TaxID=1033008 RepID=A0AAD7E9N6_9AGAR|nr:hypothetical protein DFH08DRAFT_825004 [Mycena albidolilacea]